MQRFAPGELEAFEKYVVNVGYEPKEVKVHEKDGNPPMVTFIFEGKGNPEDIHRLLLESPFLLKEFSDRRTDKGNRVRLLMSRREINEGRAPNDAERYGGYAFEPEMGE